MNRISRSAATFTLAGTAVLGACRSNDNANNAAPSGSDASASASAGSLEGPTRADTGQGASGMQGMKGMQGMQGMAGGRMADMMGAGMMDSMQTHMRMMDGVSAAQMKAMLPAHRQMVANMLSQLDGDMRKMNMKPDAKESALRDSVRQDLVRMPEMSAAEVRSFMPEHAARVMRLMQGHMSMMGGSKK